MQMRDEVEGSEAMRVRDETMMQRRGSEQDVLSAMPTLLTASAEEYRGREGEEEEEEGGDDGVVWRTKQGRLERSKSEKATNQHTLTLPIAQLFYFPH